MRSKTSLQGIKHISFTKISTGQKGTSGISTIANFRSYVPTKAKNTVTGSVTHFQERKYVVDSGAKRILGISNRQRHCSHRHGRLSMGTLDERFSISAIVGKTVR